MALSFDELRTWVQDRNRQELEQARAELHEQARRSQETAAQFQEHMAAIAREGGDEQAAVRHEQEAARERSVPLPNAA